MTSQTHRQLGEYTTITSEPTNGSTKSHPYLYAPTFKRGDSVQKQIRRLLRHCYREAAQSVEIVDRFDKRPNPEVSH